MTGLIHDPATTGMLGACIAVTLADGSTAYVEAKTLVDFNGAYVAAGGGGGGGSSLSDTIWTDDTNAFFVRRDSGTAITWTDVSGTASAAPGTGARPASGLDAVIDRASYAANTSGTGFSTGDLIDHIVITDPGSGVVIGNFWINSTTSAKISAPAGGALSALIQQVTIADGADVAEGAKADAAYTGSGSASQVALLKGLYAAMIAATPAGTNLIGSVAPPAGVLTILTNITRPADTTAYAVGDAFSDSTTAPTSGGFTFTGAARATGKSAILTDLLVVNSNPAATPLQGEVWIFDTAVTNVNDNAAFAISDGEALTVVAKVPFTMVTGVNNNLVHLQNLNISVTTSGSANLRFLVKVMNAYTPAASEVLSIRAKFLAVD